MNDTHQVSVTIPLPASNASSMSLPTLATMMPELTKEVGAVKVVPVKGKGDVRIPAEMRRALGISAGDDVLAEIEDDHLVIRRIALTQGADNLLGALRSAQAVHTPSDIPLQANGSLSNTRIPSGDADA